jgi:RNA polymerase sigma factor (sigma-70 family)
VTRVWDHILVTRVDEDRWQAELFEEHRSRLRAIAYRMLGSLAEADDAVQETWIRFSGADSGEVRNAGGLLTTIVGRICLNVLRSRAARPEDPVGVHIPDPILALEDSPGPEQEALLADSVGLALMVVLDTLTPAERLAFVMHDIFDIPFDEIAPMTGRSAVAARQLASRARHRVRAAGVREPDADIATQREAVNAFFAAARRGDFEGLMALLDPDVVLRADGGASRPVASAIVHGAANVASQALMFSRSAADLRPALVNGTAGVIVTAAGRPITLMSFTITNGRIVRIDGITDSARLNGLVLELTDR